MRSLFLLAALLCIMFPAPSFANFLLEAGVRVAYEDNVNGSPSGVSRNSDLSTTLFLDLGGYEEVEKSKTYTFLRGGIELYSFDKNDDLNGILAGARAGVYHIIGPVLSVQAALSAGVKDFEDDRADAVSLGATLELRQQAARRLWLKESYRYEYNEASTDTFTFHSHSAGVRMGFSFAAESTVILGYTFLVRSYDDPSAFSLEIQTASAVLERRLSRNVSLNTAYDRQTGEASSSGVSQIYRNNIYSAGVTYSY